ncbi:metallophosphoesterase family protein [Flavobacterium sp. JP2137]|uniref:metallophosphoesterase family protein n=1 Tax=Flavobacterium sp. JP2137 TaxID=3414510 RepID=UPI003D2FD692
MKNRTLVIGDIHGGYKALLQVLERAGVSAGDQLIFLGDYVDGWSESPEVVDYLLQLQQRQACVFIGGNHESLLLDWLRSGKAREPWLNNGGKASIASYSSLSAQKKQQHIAFFEQLRDFYIDDSNRLFIHAGFTNQKGVDYEFFPEYFRWDRTLWETALSVDPNLDSADLIYPKRLKIYDEIFIGHTPVTHVGSSVPMHSAGVWNVDTGAAFTGCISVMDVETKAFWQSDRLPELYPHEPGRNAVLLPE